MVACNDYILLECCIYRLLKFHFGGSPHYARLLDLFLEVGGGGVGAEGWQGWGGGEGASGHFTVSCGVCQAVTATTACSCTLL